MDITPLILAYAAAALVALAVTATFTDSIEHMLNRLIPDEASPHWARFIKFAVFVSSFAGGLPVRVGPGFMDRNAAPLPTAADGIMLIMGSASGALMAAAWALLGFFAATLVASLSMRAYAALSKRREARTRPEGTEARPARQERTGAEPPSLRKH